MRNIILIQAVLGGSVYMIYADVSSDERPPGADGRLLTSSTTKLSSLLSASLPCEGGRESEISAEIRSGNAQRAR